jgi:hypothetical protein
MVNAISASNESHFGVQFNTLLLEFIAVPVANAAQSKNLHPWWQQPLV